MSQDNLLEKRFEATASVAKLTLDSAVKNVLALKPILARILKGSVKEFADLDVAYIEEECIEGTPLVAGEAVHEDEVMPVITGINTEHSSLNEGTVTFDLKFNALIPGKEGYVHFIVNVEGQNRASYPIVKRGLYYCARMLSAQYGTVFTKEHYEKLRKVISIWVCFAGSKAKRNTITRYSLQPTSLYGDYIADESDYNLIDVVTLYIGDDMQTDNGLLKMLDKIFSKKYNVDEKKRFLQEECGIKLTQSMHKEVEGMCNYSDYVEAHGITIGESRGKKERLLQDIRNLMSNLNLSAEKAMQALNVTKEEQNELLPLI